MVKRRQRQSDGLYHIKGHKFKLLRGTRAQVWHGTAHKTQGGLEKHQLLMNKHGRIVSRKKHNTAKKEKRLLKHGYGVKPGVFGAVRVDDTGPAGRHRTRGTQRKKRSSGTRRVTIKEKRNIRSGRFSRGGRRRRRRRR